MDIDAITRSYRRWAPVYDGTFGRITRAGRRRAVAHVNARQGSLLEVGVGTGLSLPQYSPALSVTGIDFSHEMLAKAQAKVREEGLSHVKELRQMDARQLDFPDATFDTVVAMYLVSVVPEPERVVSEMARVCKPGGEVLILNHFARETGLLARIERGMAPLADQLGWHPDFPRDRVLGEPRLRIKSETSVPPLGLFTFLVLERV
ncbi:class I SAM-dependent methyltransferase [Plastorhodobacter daqingensis]|uniref:Class I SAM-dependent methyltransferase n=1 Tax=Plastorhodobacter daqingensis TaxID=1387281 RepID=A0ABW2UKP9_9RHOB